MWQMFDSGQALQAEQLVEIPQQVELPVLQVQPQRRRIAGRKPIGRRQDLEGDGNSSSRTKHSVIGLRRPDSGVRLSELSGHESVP